jgi:hypothetical protein
MLMIISRQQSSVQIVIDQNSRRMWNIYFSGSVTTNDTKSTREIKSRIAKEKAAFNDNILSPALHLNLRRGNPS